jgi:PAP2 superfamily
MKSKFLPIIISTSFLFFMSCKKEEEIKAYSADTSTPDIAVKWTDMNLFIIEKSPSNTPTYASRSLGYLGLTMYECVQAGSGRHISMNGQLKGLPTLPLIETGKKYNWILSLNAGQAFILKKLYPHTSAENVKKIDSLAAVILRGQGSEAADVIDRSVKFGEAIASTFFDWSEKDGGENGYRRNFPVVLIPTHPGSWRPPVNGQVASQLPLHPFWGNNRTFVEKNGDMSVPPMIEYSTDPQSPYYAQFLEVYNKNKILTQEEKEIATWWGDDPSETAAPPGHSINLATIAIKKVKPDLFKAAETYAKVGMAVGDAFINCWKCKYTYYAERPASYVNANIDVRWVQFWPEPPFPAFTSGHATQSAAMATVLTELYGDNFKFVDNTYEGRPVNTVRNIPYKSRTFNSFWESAEECAYSRLLGGIHTRQDNEVGLKEGRKIGNNVNALLWKK